MDHIEHSRGHEWAFKGDVAYKFLDDSGFLKQLKFGARYADREQDIKYTTYNWGNAQRSLAGNAVFMDQVGAPQAVKSHCTASTISSAARPNAPPGEWYYNGDLNSPATITASRLRPVGAEQRR